MRYKLLIFDFDGTIADTFSIGVAILNRLSARYLFHNTDKNTIAHLREETPAEMIHRLGIPLLLLPFFLRRARKEMYRQMASIHPFEGIRITIKELHEKGIPLGILTTNARKTVSEFLNEHNMEWFDFIATSSIIGSKYRRLKSIIHRHKLDPSQVLYIGDDTRDITDSRKASIPVAAVCWGYRSRDLLSKYKPDYLVETPGDLLTICLSDH
ncbi:MAG: HAD-IA family hydrolase [Fibrobacterota bacterium]